MVRGTVVLEVSRSLDEGEDSRAGLDIADGGPQGKRVVDLCAQYVSGSLVSWAGEEEVVDRLRKQARRAKRRVDRLDASQKSVQADVAAAELRQNAALLPREPTIELERVWTTRWMIIHMAREAAALGGRLPDRLPLCLKLGAVSSFECISTGR